MTGSSLRIARMTGSSVWPKHFHMRCLPACFNVVRIARTFRVSGPLSIFNPAYDTWGSLKKNHQEAVEDFLKSQDDGRDPDDPL